MHRSVRGCPLWTVEVRRWSSSSHATAMRDYDPDHQNSQNCRPANNPCWIIYNSKTNQMLGSVLTTNDGANHVGGIVFAPPIGSVCSLRGPRKCR